MPFYTVEPDGTVTEDVLPPVEPEPEIWDDVPKWEGLYEVSDQGRVRSVARTIRTSDGILRTLNGRILKPDNGTWATRVYLCDSSVGDRKTLYVANVVAEIFVPKPYGAKKVGHLNGDVTDNRAVNLFWKKTGPTKGRRRKT